MLSEKKATMEMSVGTIVTIVLLMTVLVLGIFLVQKIFGASTNAIETIDNEVQDQIKKLFTSEGKKLAVYPTSQEITLKKGDTPKGFAFSVKNKDVETAEFSYIVEADDVSDCGSSLTKAKADDFLLGGSGSFSLGPGNSLEIPRLVKFNIPETTPPCTIIYNLEVEKDGVSYTGAQIFVTIK